MQEFPENNIFADLLIRVLVPKERLEAENTHIDSTIVVHYDCAFNKIDAWCNANCKSGWFRQNYSSVYVFSLKQDATLFKLTWGGK